MTDIGVFENMLRTLNIPLPFLSIFSYAILNYECIETSAKALICVLCGIVLLMEKYRICYLFAYERIDGQM